MNDIIKQMIQYDSVEHFKDKFLYDENDFNDRFFKLYINYKILFEKYLLKKLSLKQMDDRIINSGLLFSLVNKDNMDIFQMLSTMNLKYIYLRNSLNVDKLSRTDIELIVRLNENELNKPDDKLLDLVERTFKNVLDLDRDDEEICHMVCYGPDRDDFWYDSRELVFGVRFDEYADNGLGDDQEWVDNYFNQLQFLGKLFNELSPKFSEILGIKVNFLYYDNVSIEKSMSR